MKKTLFTLALAIAGCYSYAQNTFPSNGYVGIGTTNPSMPLAVEGSAGDFSTTAHATASFIQDHTNFRGVYLGFDSADQIGIVAPSSAGTPSNLAFYNYSGTNWVETMRITSSGNVGIGTLSPDAKLTVKGIIHSQEVKVDMSFLPDYVFTPTYNLATLKEVKSYIDQNHHLPEVPSAQQVAKEGLNLGEMNATLLKKIEELTLYLIEKDKQLEQQEKKTEQQDARIATLEKALLKLTETSKQ